MRTFYKIMIYLLLLGLLTAEDCSEHGSESQLVEMTGTDMFLELEKDFIAKELEPESLQALEKRAVQKLRDLVDYINIYADSDLSIQFRKQARQMMSEAFVSETDLQLFFIDHKFKEDTILQNLLTSEGRQVKANVVSADIIKPFQVTPESDYKGEISYSLSNQNKISEKQIKIVARKVSKTFGEDSLDVWELFFMD